MSLIERYVHEVGIHLPRKSRADIQAELHSSLVDTLEDRFGPDASDAQVAEFLKQYGPPKKVAASYHPEGQYLIGPALYPLFRMVTGITFVAVLGAQLLAWGIAMWVGQSPFNPFQALAGLLSAIPSALGTIVIVFMLLQRFGVRPDEAKEEWNPESLPEIEETAPVKRWEHILGIVMGIAILVLFVFFPQWIGFMTFPGGEFFANPVIQQYIGLISVSLLAGIGMDIYLLWQGRWNIATRIAKVAANLLSVAVLLLLVQGHTLWLGDHGGAGLLDALKGLSFEAGGGFQVVGMQAFRMAFGIAAIVLMFDTLRMVYVMLRDRYMRGKPPRTIPLTKS